MSLAAGLASAPVVRPIDDWARTSEHDLPARLVRLTALPLPAGSAISAPAPASLSSPFSSSTTLRNPSTTASTLSSTMPPTTILHQHARPSLRLHHTPSPPSLLASRTPNASTTSTTSTTASPTESSISTALAPHLPSIPLLRDIGNGILTLPSPPPQLYECTFWFLECSYVSTDRTEWEMHCLSHWRGCRTPSQVRCPLCELTFVDVLGSQVGGEGVMGERRSAWDMRMAHLATVHPMRGMTLHSARPDHVLFVELWRVGVIGDWELMELRSGGVAGTGRGSGGRRFVEMERRRGRRERDTERRREGMQRVGIVRGVGRV